MKIQLTTKWEDGAFENSEVSPPRTLTAGLLIKELNKCNPNAPVAFKRWEDDWHTYLSGITQRQLVLIDDGQEYVMSRDDESDDTESYPVIFLTE
jgi:hypothetical protein